jgi:hypothetical protein
MFRARTVWVEMGNERIMNGIEEQKLEHIIKRMQADSAVDAPADAIHYAKNLFRARMTEPAKSVFERVLAVIKMDLAPNRAAFGERSAGQGQARQMLFDTGDNAIDLRIKAVDKGFDIRGQILGSGFENGEVEIAYGDQTYTATASETSEFRLTNIPAGKYGLSIRGGEKELYIEELILQ